ncbi:hypothetical protein [Microvirga aerophila]|uniref:Uncharacterized protein n=1 Tax=Microvirga aerophila TaxID=670291 RepID=A0A512BVE6_9HYPH|nr:hypothetical protein [Microvirga aerophila]GEO15817.1 hypothetical protein MAE02_35130 [Microvirga aerophila]
MRGLRDVIARDPNPAAHRSSVTTHYCHRMRSLVEGNQPTSVREQLEVES